MKHSTPRLSLRSKSIPPMLRSSLKLGKVVTEEPEATSRKSLGSSKMLKIWTRFWKMPMNGKKRMAAPTRKEKEKFVDYFIYSFLNTIISTINDPRVITITNNQKNTEKTFIIPVCEFWVEDPWMTISFIVLFIIYCLCVSSFNFIVFSTFSNNNKLTRN